MSLEDLFCNIDEFYRLFLPAWHGRLLADGAPPLAARQSLDPQ